ncbi:phage tail protein [Inquilinus sp. Marseille-Q2685]|uniref:phage tail protein n=1 Tax=Inquilinus sp. Marseille-Q2685 TaxID=2866581 RepID=UPI001CE4526B|nr:tail fiber protein [Inquilinus sp. Marseille-Q2685]
MEAFLATIMGWAPNFAPRGWAFCGGQILAISQNTALFSLLGTTYGGDGTTTFALPNLFSRLPIGAGNGPGLSNYVLGQMGGTESTILTTNNLPAHVHDGSTLAAVQPVATTTGNTVQPVATETSILGAPNFTDPGTGGPVDVNTFANNTANPVVNLKLSVSGTTGPTGGTQPFSIMPPYLAINWIIALEGIYPSRS